MTLSKSIIKVSAIAIFWTLLAQLLSGVIGDWFKRAAFNAEAELFIELILTGILIIIVLAYYGHKRQLQLFALSKNKLGSLYLKGLVFGLGTFALIWVIAVALRAVKVQVPTNGQGLIWFVPMLLGFGIQGFSEELLTRGYVLSKLTAIGAPLAGIWTNAVIFALLHAMNPGINLFAVIELVMTGVLLSLLRLRFDSLWLSAAFHTAWNFAEGPIFGVYVSGNHFSAALLQTKTNPGLDWLNGGLFGLEGGLIALAVITAVTIILISWYRRHPDPRTAQLFH
ncbi:lysostaphin resistance A-like protein [Agrilactobacillus fermenti]|uniref:CPBP family intramembrane glutamic endopeptidase n=1 Tax=Agrilactobacillus fermenti TaxID=2586909 RepID=UPI001E2EE937|nr:CPBP family intramembrane glutamic endopeptidase [Agrilactobacillus fermenti]MCD2255626.1 CPBP family intramembrane metalloprotease [Agrilactobacillus fermenti]